ncbi:adenylate kinase [Buchnera aphidicola]|uniref:Adenylate kinase n=1 Tax=Buchnera aphidicola (Artemisaphis artemisicola) TaxID=1241836 RepID=A0A4D6XMC5_9GAMM|nr:adenylate kinase [Buchnera aphidicola]QCI16138.1 adenylate kinase [Buchnera aphidicola (Artemisaphis artemisicola)]
MRIILLGAPGTGKGTQGKFITKKYNIPQISTGDMLRKNIYLKNKMGKIIKNILEKGHLVSDEIVCNLIHDRIKQKDCTNGFILDGFPRTLEQYSYLSKNQIKIDYVLELILPYHLILERISGRRIHAQSGRVYHVKFKPPKIKDKDDLTQESLTIREDDKEESIKKRLREYKKETYPLINCYLNEKKKYNLKFFQINAINSISCIQKQIEKILKK